MPQLPNTVEEYLLNGCGRCKLGGTPQCKVHNWQKEITALRIIANDCGLAEEIKWGSPCYTYKGKNVLMISALKESCVLSFFKGNLLNDEYGLLQKAGENSHIARLIKFTDVKEVQKHKTAIRDFVFQAIELEKSGQKVESAKVKESVPEELLARFDTMPELKKAFYALTPGRQRGYIIHISGAKQSATREKRIDKCIPAILSGKGFHD
jgi:uncharacterized protein YdeI (YjbR/CyaY-like superfamily)